MPRQADDLICKENDVGDSCSSWRFFVSVFFQGRISYWCLVAREWMGMDGNGWAWMGMDGNGWEWMGMG